MRTAEFHDIECTYCGTRIVEVTRPDAFSALVAHRCIEAEAFRTTTADALSQWHRIEDHA